MLLYISAICIALAVIFISFYFITAQTLFKYSDDILFSHAGKVIEIVREQDIGMHQYLADQGFLQEFSAIPGMLVVIMNSSGETVSGTIGIDPANTLFQDLFIQAKDAKQSFFKDLSINGSTMRFLVSPIEQNNKLAGVVLVAHPIDVVRMSLITLSKIIGIAFFILLIIAVIFGYVLTRVAMQPVIDISDKLNKIDMENLKERIKNPHTGDEMEWLAKTFNELLDRLKQSLEREHQFIINVTHELKTPLAILQSSIELATFKKRSNKEYEKMFPRLLVDIKRTSTVLDKILELTWSKTDNIKAQGDLFDLSGLVTELQEIAQELSASKDIVVSGEITDGIKFFGKRDKLAKAILNIIDNAVKFTPKHGQITISLLQKKEIVLKIQDSGAGIDQKDLQDIFERFYQGPVFNKGKGTGLGLAIVKEIIKAHHGKITISSRVGVGTEVVMALPSI